VRRTIDDVKDAIVVIEAVVGRAFGAEGRSIGAAERVFGANGRPSGAFTRPFGAHGRPSRACVR
jgi:hypothetical protein